MPNPHRMIKPQPGLVGGYQGQSLTIETLLAAFASLALYNAAELTVLIFANFRRYNGLYFWSMLLSTVAGVIPTTIGNILHFYAVGPLWLALALSNFGYHFMVPGQSFILYSRLHLVLYDPRILRITLCVILFSAVFLTIPTTITTFGSAYTQDSDWNEAYDVVERLQVTWFSVQEFIISGLYIWETIKLLRLGNRRKRITCELLFINFVVIACDVPIMTLEYVALYYLQVSLKPTIYSIKLRLEFAILGRLIAIANHDHDEQLHIRGSSRPGMSNLTNIPSTPTMPDEEGPLQYQPMKMKDVCPGQSVFT